MALLWPLLKDHELFPCLREMSVSLTAEQLAKPTPDAVRTAFESLVSTLMGVTREEVNQPVFEAINELEHPELYDESIPVTNFFRYVCKLLKAAGYKDFAGRDLYKPEEKRLRNQLSAVVNYAKFREMKLEAYLEWQSETDALIEEQAVLQEALAKHEAEVQRLQQERAAQEPEAAQLREETDAVCAENRGLAAEMERLQQEVLAWDAEVAGRKQAANELELQSAKIRADCDALQGQIVESPEELRASLEELREALAQEREAAAHTERRTRDLNARTEAVKKAEHQLLASMEQLEGAGQVMDSKHSVSRAAKTLQAELDTKQQDAQKSSTQHTALERMKKSLTEKLSSHEHQSKAKRDAALAQRQSQQMEKEAIQAENAANLAKLREHDSLKQSIQAKIDELKTTHVQQKENVLQEYKSLVQQVEKYNAQLKDVMHPKPPARTPLKSVLQSLPR